MKTLYNDDFDALIFEAGDEDLERAYILMQEEPSFPTLYNFFDISNYDHYDRFDDELVTGDKKRLKKILRGQDVTDLIQLALDLGRIIGRAEYKLLNEET